MNLSEIINKPEPTQDEMLFAIQQYIKIRKGEDVNPVIDTSRSNMYTMVQLQQMRRLYFVSAEWLRDNQTEWNSDK